MPLSPTRSPLAIASRRCAPLVFWASAFALAVVVEASGWLPNAPEARLAYLDPGSGSFMIQALVAALAGIAVTVRTYWSKIRTFFGAAPAEDEEPVVKPNDE